jgi:hypothetical protein
MVAADVILDAMQALDVADLGQAAPPGSVLGLSVEQQIVVTHVPPDPTVA